MADCIIGVLHKSDYSELVTLEDLKCHIEARIAFNKECDKYGMIEIKYREYRMKDYADGRCSTNLTMFKYCPECGKKIDWASIRRNEDATT